MRGRHVLNVVLWLVVITFHELHKADLSEAFFCYFIPEDFLTKFILSAAHNAVAT